ncbi:hypothetical protein [Kouleothrix sp.]|uniref:hypothetical protein n=1 Tax=Kouleothrix sp. TaxID=2779161 RepID=UPI00391A3383
MRTIELAGDSIDWTAAVEAVSASGEPAVLTLHGVACGLLLPEHTARRLAARYAPAPPAAHDTAVAWMGEARNYLELLRADPTMVPVVDGQPLEFVTMMNSSYIDPQQLYQFKHPVTRQIYIYRSGELQRAIGHTFVSVDFVPDNPKGFVEGKG